MSEVQCEHCKVMHPNGEFCRCDGAKQALKEFNERLFGVVKPPSSISDGRDWHDYSQGLRP